MSDKLVKSLMVIRFHLPLILRFRFGDTHVEWCKVLYLPPLFERGKWLDFSSQLQHYIVPCIQRSKTAALVKWHVVGVYLGSERSSELWCSCFQYRNSGWPFLFHPSPTRHQRAVLTNFFLCDNLPATILVGCVQFCKRSFEHGFVPWAFVFVQDTTIVFSLGHL